MYNDECILSLSQKNSLVVREEKSPKTIVIPRYEPVFVEPNLKEYETQVLQMSVPVDEADFGTANSNRSGGKAVANGVNGGASRRRDSREEQNFSLDSISYITKDATGANTTATSYSEVGGESPSSSGSSGGGGQGRRNGRKYSNLAQESPLMTPIRNPLFHRTDSEEGIRHLSTSQTNVNVVFGAGAEGFAASTPRARNAAAAADEALGPDSNTTQL